MTTNIATRREELTAPLFCNVFFTTEENGEGFFTVANYGEPIPDSCLVCGAKGDLFLCLDSAGKVFAVDFDCCKKLGDAKFAESVWKLAFRIARFRMYKSLGRDLTVEDNGEVAATVKARFDALATD